MPFGVFKFLGVKIELYPNLGEEVLRGQKRKIALFFSQSIEHQKSYNISKNQSPESIRRRIMGFPPPFDLKKVLLSFLQIKQGS